MIPKELERVLMQVQKPARYIGGELGCVIKDKSQIEIRIAFCFPDMYEVGMSHLGMKILYALYNQYEDTWCERVFAPDADMEAVMRREGIPLYGLESFDGIGSFDFIAFTLQYELSYTGILNMLDLAGIPLHSKDRTALAPLVIAGGPCACNPEPIADFLDIVILGEGEEVNIELNDLYRIAKKEGWTKERFLLQAAQIQGIYVPSFYDVAYHEDGTIQSVTPNRAGVPATITKRIIKDLDKVFFPESFVVPFVETIHDRAMIEVLRGCIRGCRFCQAGFTYRPFREKSAQTLNKDSRCLCEATGYDELSLTSLSTSDLSDLEGLLDNLLDWTPEKHVNLSLPSLRADNFPDSLLQKISKVRKSGLTFAPEAGSQRLRDVINKNLSEEEILNSCRIAFEGGHTAVKLYFMMGLPTETKEDIEGIGALAQEVVNLFYSLPNKPKGKGVSVSVSCACFVPKPFTPFQFEPQDTVEQFQEKQKTLLGSLRSRKTSVSYHDSKTSLVEAVLARGDRRLCAVVERAWQKGSKLDGWNEYLNTNRWFEALAEEGLEEAFYANRRRSYEEVMPWEHLDYGVSKAFLIEENKLAVQSGATTPNCREHCSGCAANKLLGRACFAK